MTPRHAAKVPSGHVDAGAGDVTNNMTSGNTRVPGLAGIDLSRVLMIAREQQLGPNAGCRPVLCRATGATHGGA